MTIFLLGAVVNNSNGKLSAFDKSVLNKSFNFATIIRWVSYLDMIVPMKKVVLKILKLQADEKMENE